MCGLDSESTGCSEEKNLTTINCRCYRSGVVSEDCEGKVVNVVSGGGGGGGGKKGEGGRRESEKGGTEDGGWMEE